MGYDMEWEEIPPDLATATEAAFERALAANRHAKERADEVKQRKPDAVPATPFFFATENEEADPELAEIEQERMEAWETLREVQRSYFRLNIWGMAACVDIMHDCGMLALDRPQEAEFSNVPEPPGEEHFDGDGKPTTDEGRFYERMIEGVLAAESSEPGIPAWKLSSNDGWLVTPKEINEALAAAPPGGVTIIEEGEKVTVTWWPKWLRFLREAADHGGFRVL